MSLFLVERFWPGVTPQAVDAMVERLDRQSAGNRDVTHISSVLVQEEETCLCFFESDLPELVAEVNDRAAAPFDRIVSASPHPQLGRSP